jgi:catechol 2,3-dioxygenase-like lactoylglutathione lyase family enzyme
MADPLDRLLLPTVSIAPRPEFAAALRRRIQGRDQPTASAATVRYFVEDLDAAVGFYCEALDFEAELRPSPAFAMLYRNDLRLLLSVPGETHALAGTLPEPGGWNRISIEVPDLEATVAALRSRGDDLRNEIVTSVGVRQIVVADPSGNLVELFERIAGYHERAPDRTP